MMHFMKRKEEEETLLRSPNLIDNYNVGRECQCDNNYFDRADNLFSWKLGKIVDEWIV